MSVDEAALVRRCRRGEADAIRALVEQFQAEVYGLCVRLLNHRHDAEDVTQEVFLRVFRSLGRWDRSRPLKPWIMGIAVNRCRTWLAQRSRRPQLAEYLQDTAPSPEADDAAELLREIHTALGDLRPEYRSVFILFHEHGQPYEEIAAALGRPVGTIKTWLHRARLEVLERLRRRGMVSPESAAGLNFLERSPVSASATMNCPEFQNLLQQHFDGTAEYRLADVAGHLAACPECRSWQLASLRLRQGLARSLPTLPPAGLSERIVALLLAERSAVRRRWLYGSATGLAAAAALLLVALAASSWLVDHGPHPAAGDVPAVPRPSWSESVAGRGGPRPGQEIAPASPASLHESVAQAGEAMVSLTRRTADETVGQGRLLVPLLQPPSFEDPAQLPRALDPTARSLREAGEGVSAGLEPVTNSARRAIDLFLRDIPPVGMDGKQEF